MTCDGCCRVASQGLVCDGETELSKIGSVVQCFVLFSLTYIFTIHSLDLQLFL
jgi:hypothetical protein